MFITRAMSGVEPSLDTMSARYLILEIVLRNMPPIAQIFARVRDNVFNDIYRPWKVRLS